MTLEDLIKRFDDSKKSARIKDEDEYVYRPNVYDPRTEVINTQMPSQEQLRKWYGHIEKLEVYIYVIEVLAGDQCPYCIAFQRDIRQVYFLKYIFSLLGKKSPEGFETKTVGADWSWNIVENYKDANGKIRPYPFDSTNAKNHQELYGRDIEYFPAVRFNVKSKILHEKTGNDTKEYIFQGLAHREVQKAIYEFNGVEYVEEVEVSRCDILRPLLRFLQHLDLEREEFRHHKKYDKFKLGQIQHKPIF